MQVLLCAELTKQNNNGADHDSAGRRLGILEEEVMVQAGIDIGFCSLLLTQIENNSGACHDSAGGLGNTGEDEKVHVQIDIGFCSLLLTQKGNQQRRQP